MELAPEMRDHDREHLVDDLLAKWDAVFYALCETQMPPHNETPPGPSYSPSDGVSL